MARGDRAGNGTALPFSRGSSTVFTQCGCIPSVGATQFPALDASLSQPVQFLAASLIHLFEPPFVRDLDANSVGPAPRTTRHAWLQHECPIAQATEHSRSRDKRPTVAQSHCSGTVPYAVRRRPNKAHGQAQARGEVEVKLHPPDDATPTLGSVDCGRFVQRSAGSHSLASIAPAKYDRSRAGCYVAAAKSGTEHDAKERSAAPSSSPAPCRGLV
ncbi:hypothetical protein CPLU01_08036 [Colletotrichum plurivorum]|uniref:Uncharacterized protein n=1 Tax=Colletotrichum plurivorum TaxID=2175906 RepID=A0A8H6KCT0_9PEZI|nr:hypothetical protein CPLU01_08036 [Colletotrichum plurivorum]